MAAHRYWRLVITANAGDADFLAISELEMRATAGGADQCNGGTPSASSINTGAEADKAFDNNATTRWSTGPAGVTTGTLAYDFGSAVTVAEYTIQSHPTLPARSPKDFTLQWSDNGTAWTVADSRAATAWTTGGQIRTFTVPAEVEGTYFFWRLNISANNASEFLSVNEVEMRATTGGADQCNGGAAFASTILGGGFEAAKAFDNDPLSNWLSASSGVAQQSGWLKYQFPTAVNVAQYTIRSDQNITRSPRDWALERSVNNVDWVAVDSRSSITWTAEETKTFTISTTPASAARPQVFVCT